MTDFNIVLFDGFETLDAFGPAEVIGNLQDIYRLGYFSTGGGAVTSSHQVRVSTRPFSEMAPGGVLLVPGGMGTRALVDDAAFISALSAAARGAAFVLSVCTGSALLAKTGLLNGRRATSNKIAFDWVESTNGDVVWIKRARWVVDGTFYTSSGVSAGIDMALGFVGDQHGQAVAQRVANSIEYIWNTDKDTDPFSV